MFIARECRFFGMEIIAERKCYCFSRNVNVTVFRAAFIRICHYYEVPQFPLI
jgi:hypothetical protein